jgi:3-phosphoglycerate kinase
MRCRKCWARSDVRARNRRRRGCAVGGDPARRRYRDARKHRFWKGEEKNDPELAKAIAANGDLYVNDAFSAAHRAHATTEGLAHLLPAYAGRSMEAELKALEKPRWAIPEHPVAAVVGGAKVSSKLDVLKQSCGARSII